MVDKNEVQTVLDLIRPSLIADGGDATLVDISEDGVVTVQLTGACNGCPLSAMTLAHGIERILKASRVSRALLPLNKCLFS